MSDFGAQEIEITKAFNSMQHLNNPLNFKIFLRNFKKIKVLFLSEKSFLFWDLEVLITISRLYQFYSTFFINLRQTEIVAHFNQYFLLPQLNKN